MHACTDIFMLRPTILALAVLNFDIVRLLITKKKKIILIIIVMNK